MTRIHIGYFKNFKSSDTVLIEGDGDNLRRFAIAHRALASAGISEDCMPLHELDFVQMHGGLHVSASCHKQDRGLFVRSPDNILWELSTKGWNEAADKVEMLIPNSNGHQYLNAGNGLITVQVSMDEYGTDWWRKHG